MNVEIINVISWLRVNKLSLNLKKTHYVLFHRKRSKFSIEKEVMVDGVKIHQVEKTKFLGIVIDENLSFVHHVKYIKGKVARGIGILCKARRLVHQSTMVTLYNSFIYPYLYYCIAIWGNTFSSYLEPLVKLQKRAVRLIKGAKRLDHTDPIFSELRLLKIREIYVYCIQQLMFKYHHELLPDVFSNYFTTNSHFHNYDTRKRNEFHMPLIKSGVASTCVRKVGVYCYNYFKKVIEINCSRETYKKSLKKYILEHGISCLFQ